MIILMEFFSHINNKARVRFMPTRPPDWNKSVTSINTVITKTGKPMVLVYSSVASAKCSIGITFESEWFILTQKSYIYVGIIILSHVLFARENNCY